MTIPRMLLLALGGATVLAAAYAANFRPSFCLEKLPVIAASVQVTDETVIDETFPVRPGELLEIRVAHSDVIIASGPSDEAHVRVTISGRDMQAAREFFRHLNFSVEKTGRTLAIRTDPRERWNSNGTSGDIDVFVIVPEIFDADVNVAHGDVEVGSLKGRLSFASAHGDLDIGTLSGSLLSVSASHGDISAERMTGEKIRIEASHGNIEAGEVVAAEIESTTRHGDIEIGRLEGRPSVSATHGDIEITLGGAEGGRFRSSHGDIDISAPAGTSADVDFRASDIEIATLFKFQGTQSRDRIEGRLNGGGPRFEAHASHGSVRLRGN